MDNIGLLIAKNRKKRIRFTGNQFIVTKRMIVSILGCGWYGKALAKELLQKGIVVKGSATSAEKLETLKAIGITPFIVQINADQINYDADFFKSDVLVISIPPGLKKGEGSAYLPKIKHIIQVILDNNIQKVIYINSTGVYGDHNKTVTENDAPNADTESGKILFEAENLFRSENIFKTTIIRFAGLVGPGRHPGRFFAAKKDIPNGLAPVNMIHLDDCVGISSAIIEEDVFGYLFNACLPDHPTKEDFYNDAALKGGYEVPQFIHELKTWKIIESIALKPILNYTFKIKNWKEGSFDALPQSSN
ncbi:SDR family oxidoreductase [Mucilaginibacter sp. BT774]|uniref:SDR family oxidoreductase n=1 Tax=Mucilaginibacter sp. BT774 TaxID=3062276 RepID=UPI002674AAEA|nr:SDR family oxidoreductase [Mucilaginibacter sp. BT774]MDO3627721.1 SDR family oxidoreductase [Mucilaginibacter sp. BT774]